MSYTTTNSSKMQSQPTRYYETYKRPLKSYTFSTYDANKRNYKPFLDQLRKKSSGYIDEDNDESYEESSITFTYNEFEERSNGEAIKVNINEKIKENELIYKQSKCIQNRFDELIAKNKNEKAYDKNTASTNASVKRSQSLKSNCY